MANLLNESSIFFLAVRMSLSKLRLSQRVGYRKKKPIAGAQSSNFSPYAFSLSWESEKVKMHKKGDRLLFNKAESKSLLIK